MTITKNQFLRKEILHGLLSRNKLTRSELFSVLNSHLEAEGIEPVSLRTLYYDLESLEGDGAVIHRPVAGDDRYYYSQRFIPRGTTLDDEDLDVLQQAVGILKSICGLPIARDVEQVFRKLKYTGRMVDFSDEGLISFEDYTMAGGTEWIDTLSEALFFKIPVIINYKPFTKDEMEFTFHPYYLKEYRNRWYVFGRSGKTDSIYNLALDRILKIRNTNEEYIINDLFNPGDYFKNLIGVTYYKDRLPEEIQIEIIGETVPYVETKKIHASQNIIERKENGNIIISLFLIVNYELISNLLALGEGARVIKPQSLRHIIGENLRKTLSYYHV